MINVGGMRAVEIVTGAVLGQPEALAAAAAGAVGVVAGVAATTGATLAAAAWLEQHRRIRSRRSSEGTEAINDGQVESRSEYTRIRQREHKTGDKPLAG